MGDEQEDKDLDDIVKDYANEHLDDDLHHQDDNEYNMKETHLEDLNTPTLLPKKEVAEQKPKHIDTKTVFLKGATVKKQTKKKKKAAFTKEDFISRLERYEEYDRNHPDNQAFPSDENFKGPIAIDKRKRTDFVWVILYIILMTAFFIYSVIVFKEGDSRRLIRGIDFRSEICGISKLQSRPFLYFANPSLDINVAFCVQSCPKTTGQKIYLYDVDGNTDTPFWYTQIESKPLGFNCLPIEPISKKIVDEHLSELSNTLKRIVGDMGHSSDIMGLGCGLAVIFGYIFLLMLKSGKGTKYVVWGCIWGTIFCFLTLCLMCWTEYKRTIDFKCLFGIDKYDCGGIKAKAYYWTTVGLGIFGFLYLLLVMKLFNRINFAIGLIKTSSKVTNVLEQIKYIPYITVGTAIVLGAYILTVIIFSISVGQIFVIPAKGIDGGYTKILVFTQTMRYMLVGAIFTFLFTLFIISAFSDMVTSYCLCVWFFTKRSITLILPIKLALKVVLKYHLGTVIKSAILFPIFAIPKLILGWIRRRLRNRRQTSTLIKFVITSCFCCIHLNEKLMRYVSKHSYIQTAIFGKNFRDGGRISFYLLNRHRNKVKDVDFLQEFVIFQTKICPSLLASLFVYIFITYGEKSIIGNRLSEIETAFGPSLFVLYIGYLYAAMFQGSFDIISKTVIQCYLLDGEMFVGDQRYVEPFIKEFMEYFGKEFDDKKIEVKSALPENTAITRVNPNWNKEEEKHGEIHEEDVTDSDQSSKSSDSDEEEEKPKPIDPLGTTMKSNSGKNPNFLNADDLDKKRGLTPITTTAKQMKSAAFDPFGMEEKKDKSVKSALSRTETSVSNSSSLVVGKPPAGGDSKQVSKSNFFEKKPEIPKDPPVDKKIPVATNKTQSKPIIITPEKPGSRDGKLDFIDSKPEIKEQKVDPSSIPKIQTNYEEIPNIKDKQKPANDEWDFFNEKPQINNNSKLKSGENDESKNNSKTEKSKDNIIATSWGDFDDAPKPKKLVPQNLAYTFAQPNMKMKDNQKILNNSNSGSAILDINKRKPKEVDIWNFDNNNSKVNDTMNFEHSFDVDTSKVKKGYRNY